MYTAFHALRTRAMPAEIKNSTLESNACKSVACQRKHPNQTPRSLVNAELWQTLDDMEIGLINGCRRAECAAQSWCWRTSQEEPCRPIRISESGEDNALRNNEGEQP